MGDPPTMEMSVSDPSLSEVSIILPTNPRHLFLETGELIFEVFKVVFEDIQLGRLPAHQLR